MPREKPKPWFDIILKAKKTMTFDQYVDVDEEIGPDEVDLGVVSDTIKRWASMWQAGERRKNVLIKKLKEEKLSKSRNELEELIKLKEQVPVLHGIVRMHLQNGFDMWGQTIELRKGFRAVWRMKKDSED